MGTSLTESANAVASAFVAARREARALANYPGDAPADLPAAYQIQDCAIALDGPYGAVRFLLANLSARGFDLGGGLWVSTGAITGVHRVEPGVRVKAMFGSHGEVQCRIAAAQGQQ